MKFFKAVLRVLKSFCLTFSMYSRIPMPKVYWSKENLRYSLCFLPLVGVVIGGLLMAWFWVCMTLHINNACFAAGAAVLPIIVTGGIHADGFIDTSDALASYGDKHKRLNILSDPHVGAFAVISAVAYYLLTFGFLNEITIYGEAAMLSLGFVMSRSVCAVAISLMKCAKNTGLLYKFSTASNKPITIIVTTLMLLLCAYVIISLSPFIGALVLLGLIILFFYYRFVLCKKFGGISGDTCGWLISMCELLTLIIVVIGGRLA